MNASVDVSLETWEVGVVVGESTEGLESLSVERHLEQI